MDLLHRLQLGAASPWGRRQLRRLGVVTAGGLAVLWAFVWLLRLAINGSLLGILVLTAAVVPGAWLARRLRARWPATGRAAEGDSPTFAPLCSLRDRGRLLEDRDDRGRTPLLRALDSGYARAAWELLGLGADGRAVDESGRGAVLFAIHGWERRKDEESLAWLVRALVRHGADPDATDRHGRSPPHAAITHGYPTVVELLLDEGADPNRADEKGVTPLHRAAAGGETAIAELLIDRGAELDPTDANGARPVHWALFHLTRRGQRELYHRKRLLARRLIQRGARVDLLTAIGFNLEERVRHILDEGGERLEAAPSLFECDPIGLAVVYAEADLVRLLLERGADPNGRAFGEPALVRSVAERGDPEIVRALLDRGADVNAHDASRRTALHHAVAVGSVEIAELLLRHGADPDAESDRGRTPISMAQSHEAMMEVLREMVRA